MSCVALLGHTMQFCLSRSPGLLPLQLVGSWLQFHFAAKLLLRPNTNMFQWHGVRRITTLNHTFMGEDRGLPPLGNLFAPQLSCSWIAFTWCVVSPLRRSGAHGYPRWW